jgi:hypothetical protein
MLVCWFAPLQVYALGFVSVFDQVLDGFDSADKDKIWKAYVQALGEDPAQYRVSRGDGTGGEGGGRTTRGQGVCGGGEGREIPGGRGRVSR